MANEISLYIGSFALDGTNQISISDIAFQIAKSIQEYALPKAHGSVIPVGFRKSINCNMKGTIIGSDYDALRTNLDALRTALESTSEQSLTLDDDRYIKVQYKNFGWSYKMLRTFAEFSFDVVASYPFWLANSLTTDDKNTATSGVGWTINNPGTAPARCKILISNSGSALVNACKFENQTTGQTFQYTGTLVATKQLIVDNKVVGDDLAVTNDGADSMTSFEGDFITLNPGNNTVVFTGTAGTRIQTIFRQTNY